jgi:hypothetical protein
MVVWVASVLASGALGIVLGVRRERGRYARYRAIVAERKPRSGVKLRTLRVRR